MPLSLGPIFSGMVSSVDSQEPSDVLLYVKSTYSDEEEPDYICFPSIQWEMGGQSFVEDSAGLYSAGVQQIWITVTV